MCSAILVHNCTVNQRKSIGFRLQPGHFHSYSPKTGQEGRCVATHETSESSPTPERPSRAGWSGGEQGRQLPPLRGDCHRSNSMFLAERVPQNSSPKSVEGLLDGITRNARGKSWGWPRLLTLSHSCLHKFRYR